MKWVIILVLIGFLIGGLFVLFTEEENSDSNFGEYNLILEIDKLETSEELSGITYNFDTNTLFGLHAYGTSLKNEISEIDLEGNFIRSIGLAGFEDLEGITYIGDNLFAVVEERKARIGIVRIDEETNFIKIGNSEIYDFGLGNLGNSGLEGITYNLAKDIYYIIKEKDPKKIYVMGISSDLDVKELFDSEIYLSELNDLSGVYYDSKTDSLFILSDESKKVLNVKLNGTLINSFDVDLKQGKNNK